MSVHMIWLSPECIDARRSADIQQKQLSLIRHYRATLAEKDDEIQMLKAGLDQRHALIDQQRVEIDGLRQDVKTLKNMLRTKGDELAALRRSPSVVETARMQAELLHLRKANADLQAERETWQMLREELAAQPTPGTKADALGQMIAALDSVDTRDDMREVWQAAGAFFHLT